MKSFFTDTLRTVKCIAIFILSFFVLSIVNMLHDPLINSFAENGYVNDIPGTPMAQFISICTIFLTGIAAAFVMIALSGNLRNVMSSILLVLFLIIDIQAAFQHLANTTLLYRFSLVSLVPIEIGLGYLGGMHLHQRFENWRNSYSFL